MMIEQKLIEGRHPAFLQPENNDCLVWRYMDLPKFISLLACHKLYLTAIDKLGDPHEGSVTLPCQERLNQGSSMEQYAKWREQIRKNSFVSCWSMSNDESESMWQIYCGRDQGVAIQTTYCTLSNSIPVDRRLGIGVIRYLNYQTDDMPDYNCYTPIMHKRNAFKHEQEVRILCSMVGELYDEGDVDRRINKSGVSEIVGMRLPWNPEEIVTRICINPYAMPWYADVVKITVEKFSPKLAACIEWSKMRADPNY